MAVMDVTYRELTYDDFARIVELAEALANELPIDPRLLTDADVLERRARIRARTEYVLDQGVVLGAECGGLVVGIFAVSTIEHPMLGYLMAGESAWYVVPSFRSGDIGRTLLKQAERWARAHGCELLEIACPIGSDAGPYYTRQGFAPIETVFIKWLPAAGGERE